MQAISSLCPPDNADPATDICICFDLQSHAQIFRQTIIVLDRSAIFLIFEIVALERTVLTRTWSSNSFALHQRVELAIESSKSLEQRQRCFSSPVLSWRFGSFVVGGYLQSAASSASCDRIIFCFKSIQLCFGDLIYTPWSLSLSLLLALNASSLFWIISSRCLNRSFNSFTFLRELVLRVAF